MHVVVGFRGIAFGIPIHREVAVGERQRICLHGLFHQSQSFSEFAIVDGHLPQAMQRNCAREWIGRHGKNRFKNPAGFLPLARLVAIELPKVAQRRGISGIHALRL